MSYVSAPSDKTSLYLTRLWQMDSHELGWLASL